MELDAADWLNIMILHIGLRVNRASKKVRYEPEAPSSGLDWVIPGRPGPWTISRSCWPNWNPGPGPKPGQKTDRPEGRLRPVWRYGDLFAGKLHLLIEIRPLAG